MLTTVLLAATALAAGVTGTWSPCGFSMLSTLGPTGHTGGRRTTFAACATFAAGALAGGVATFLTLALLGRAVGAGSPAAAAAIALAAAAGEARGVRVLPQVRRQVPEHWRRVMPLPLAGGLYGLLLGLGFTTFVLTLAVWALAGVCVALGDPVAGLAVGLAFGAGRALPVVALAPWIDGERGIRCAELMAERPAVLRSLRQLDGALLVAVALTVAIGAGGAGSSAARPPPAASGPAAPASAVAAGVPRAPGDDLSAAQPSAVASGRVAAAAAVTPSPTVVPLVSAGPPAGTTLASSRGGPRRFAGSPVGIVAGGVAHVAAGGSAAVPGDRLPAIFAGGTRRRVSVLRRTAVPAALLRGVGTARSAVQPTLVAPGATDPTLGGGALAWTAEPGGGGELLGAPGGPAQALAGGDPALGGPYLAVARGGQVTVTDGGAPVGQLAIPGVDALAVSADWLVARVPDAAGRALLFAYPLPALGPATLVAAEPSGTDIGRPALDGDRLVAAINAPSTSRIVEFDLAGGARSVLRQSRGSQLLNPALLGDRLLYERATYCDQRLVIGSPTTAAGARVVLRIGAVAARDKGYEPGHTTIGSAPSRCPQPVARRTATVLWTTALAPTGAYVTELRPQPRGPPQASILALPLSSGPSRKYLGVWTRLAPPGVRQRATGTPADTVRRQITPSRSPATQAIHETHH